MTNISITVTNSTPMLAGWYDPQLVDPLGLRPTEIKGLWRYWARTVIAGALYDKGLLVGRASRGVPNTPTRQEVEAISCYVGRILGLGFGGERSESSRFKIKVEALKPLRPNLLLEDCATKYGGYQRIRLLSIRRRVSCIDVGATFKIEVVRNRVKYDDGEKLALKILLLALQLNGIGKGSRKGLGSLDITSISELEVGGDLKKLLDEVYNEASEIVDKSDYRRECLRYSVGAGSPPSIPPLPVLSKNQPTSGVYISEVYNVNGMSSIDAHNFFLRSYRCSKIQCSQVQVDWFLGLPRRNISSDRRASPVFLAYHGKGNKFGSGVFVTVLLSSDWPGRVVGSHHDVINARNMFINDFRSYVNAVNASIRRVWPQ